MRRKVPDDVYIVLKKPEIHAHRVEIIDLAQTAGRDDLLHLAHGTGVDKRVIDKELKSLFCRPDSISSSASATLTVIGFSIKQCLPASSGAFRDLKMCGNRSCDDDDVDIVRSIDASCSSARYRSRETLSHLSETIFVEVAGDDAPRSRHAARKFLIRFGPQ